MRIKKHHIVLTLSAIIVWRFTACSPAHGAEVLLGAESLEVIEAKRAEAQKRAEQIRW